MGENEDEISDEPQVTERPATWENVVAGEAKEAAGHLLHNKNLAEEGEEQIEIAHEVREEYQEEHDSPDTGRHRAD